MTDSIKYIQDRNSKVYTINGYTDNKEFSNFNGYEFPEFIIYENITYGNNRYKISRRGKMEYLGGFLTIYKDVGEFDSICESKTFIKTLLDDNN